MTAFRSACFAQIRLGPRLRCTTARPYWSRGAAEYHDSSTLLTLQKEEGDSKFLDNWLHNYTSEDEQTSAPRLLRKIGRLMREAVYLQKPEIPASQLTELCSRYRQLGSHDRWRTLITLGSEFGIDKSRVQRLAQHVAAQLASASEATSLTENRSLVDETRESTVERALRDLRTALDPLSAGLFSQINAQPGGLKFLVDLRADLLALLKTRNWSRLRALDDTLRLRLKTWLGPACLELRRITWQDPAALLEKLVLYEAVHPMDSILDLKTRLGAGRRCFAYFHPAMPGEPLIFIEVALTSGPASSIQEVLASQTEPLPESSATMALFYSISSTQPGLAGVDLGHALICDVVNWLQRELPHIKEFETLSPIPSFAQWLRARLFRPLGSPGAAPDQTALFEGLISGWSAVTIKTMLEWLEKAGVHAQDAAACLEKLNESPALMKLCAHYLTRERKRGQALNPVTNFHVRNGASVERLLWMGDRSSRGLQQSLGIMVAYKYRLETMDKNSQLYIGKGQIPTSDAVQALLQPAS